VIADGDASLERVGSRIDPPHEVVHWDCDPNGPGPECDGGGSIRDRDPVDDAVLAWIDAQQLVADWGGGPDITGPHRDPAAEVEAGRTEIADLDLRYPRGDQAGIGICSDELVERSVNRTQTAPYPNASDPGAPLPPPPATLRL
jgi:hypothetical protein